MTLEIQQFLELIWGDQTGNVVIGQMDKPGPKGQLSRSWDFKYPEQLAEIVSFVNDRTGTDMYASPLIYGDTRDEVTGRLRRIPENALTSQVVYQDSDTCSYENFRLRPSIHVTSSAGRYQDYWILEEPIPADEAALLSRRIAVAHRDQGSDPSSWSANKYLRIPTTTNTRHGFPETVTAEVWGDIYSVEDHEREYGKVDVSVYRPIARLIDSYVDSDVDLPDFQATYNSVPLEEIERLGLDRLLFEPYPDDKRSETRYRLLCNLFRVNPPLELEQILALAWRAPSSSKWHDDPRNIAGLIMEASKAQTDVGYEKGLGISAPEPGEITRVNHDKVERPPVALLSDAERLRVGNIQHFVRRYETWSQSKLGPAHNAPYARMNAWTILGCAFSDFGVIPSTGDSLNMWGIGIGDSGSGKSSSRRLMMHCVHEVLDGQDGWYLGVNASPSALHEKLLERDKKVSLFSGDEAHGWFKTANEQQWADGIYEMLAEFYDGDVPPILRTSKRDLSGKSAKAYFNVHLMGTMKGEMAITNVLTRSMFFSGFLPRFTWYIGDERVVTPESLEESNGDGEHLAQGFEPMARQWAAEFNATKKRLKLQHKRDRLPMNMTQEALDRLTAMKWHAREIAVKRNEWEVLEPCLIRLGPSVRRAASLVALEDGRDLVTLDDLLVAIEQAEEWLASLFIMSERVALSAWARETDEIESFLASKPNNRALIETVKRRFRSRRNRDLDEQINSLIGQGRIKEASVSGKRYLMINEGEGTHD